MRIAVVGACPYPVPQGSQVYLRETARALERAGHDVRLVVYGYGTGEERSGLPIHRSAPLRFAKRTKAGPSIAKPLLDWMLARTLRRVCKEHAIDAVSAHNYEGLLVALLARRRPIVYHAHNAMQDELPAYFAGAHWARRFGEWLDGTLPRRADVCVVPHERLKAYLIECGCRSEDIVVIPPSIDAVGSTAPARVSAPGVLYTGNLDPYQNLSLLAAAMECVRETQPDARLTIVSADSLAGSPFAGADWVDHVEASDRDVLRNALCEEAVFVCPRVSWSGFPMKLLNAMSAGQAIVCCAASAHPLTHDLDGMIVDDTNPLSLAAAIVRMRADAALRARLGEAARASFERNHGATPFASRLNEVYRAAAGA